MLRASLIAIALTSCMPAEPDDMDEPGDDVPTPLTSSVIKHVFVIAMENHAASSIYGNTTSAPYIQTLVASYGHATNFIDKLPTLPSEPHYVWMEAGTNAF